MYEKAKIAGVHFVVGGEHTGKTTLVKKLVSGKKCLIHDINNEYYQNEKYVLPSIDDFVEQARHVQRTIVVFEEATIAFGNHKRGDAVTDLCVRKWHSGNYYVFVFHTLRTIPVEIWDSCNYLTLFKTGDRADIVDGRLASYPGLPQYWRMVNAHPDRHFYKTLKLK